MIASSRPDLAQGWLAGECRALPLVAMGEHYRRYRLPDAGAEAAMAASLTRHGQISPVVVCLREEQVELLDGFKRLSAARQRSSPAALLARRLDLDEREAKAALLGLNGVGGRVKELEEAWVVQALVREDGLSQLEVAGLLNRHKSWVCRRLALLERLASECQEDLRLGLLSPTVARQLTRLPVGNQVETQVAARREGLSAAEVQGVVDLLVGCPGRPQMEFVLEQPRRALRQAQSASGPAYDPRLSAAGNRVLRQVSGLLDGLSRLETWLRQRGRADLSPEDRGLLAANFGRLSCQSQVVAELLDDLLTEVDVP